MKRIIPLIIAIAMIVTLMPMTTGIAFAGGEDMGTAIIDLTGDEIFYYDEDDYANYNYYDPVESVVYRMAVNGEVDVHPIGRFYVGDEQRRFYDLDQDGHDDFITFYDPDDWETTYNKSPDTNLTGHYILKPSSDTVAELKTEEYFNYYSCMVFAYDKVSVKKCKTSSLAKSKTWTGKAIKPSLKLKSQGRELTKGTDYKVTYSNNKNVGKAKITITGKGIFKGTTTKYFKINPKGTSISSLSSLYKGFKVVWKKQASQTSGYQVCYANNSKFKNSHTKTVSGATKTSRSVTKLASKKYWVKVRTYKIVNGTKYYSKWSDVKTVSPRQ